MEYRLKRGDFEITTDRSKMQIDVIHRFLQKSYWASERTPTVIQRSIENSLPFGLFNGGNQIGFARVITDYATFAWIADVFIDESFRGQDLSKWLMESILTHPELKELRRWVLATRDAHTLYSRFGFTPLAKPDFWMEIDTRPK